MAKITLDSIRESINEKYDDFEVEGLLDVPLVLVSPLRMARADRRELMAFQERFDSVADIDEQLALMGDIVILAARDKAVAKRALKLIEADPDADAILIEVISSFFEALQVGEASPSES